MYVELYIDLFFLVNLIMDINVLIISKKILKCPATGRSIFIGAMMAAFLTCLAVIMPQKYSFWNFTIYHGLISIVMIKIGLKIKGKKYFLKAWAVMYVSTFLLSGIFQYFFYYVKGGVFFLIISMVSCLLTLNMWEYFLHIAISRKIFCEAELHSRGNQIRVRAIIDTGNRLRDSVTGKPVNIISIETAEKLWKNFPIENLRYIPYHTIGKNDGLLPLCQIEGMRLYLEEEKYVSQVFVAISSNLIAGEEYEMILHPELR